MELAAPDFIPCFKENTCKGDIIYNNIILRKALVTSMLLFKLNLQIECNCRRFSTEELAESILEDMEIGEKRGEAVQKLSEDIKKYNKGKTRIYFQHTRKNYANFNDLILNRWAEFNVGNHLAHERAIFEIEYLLKKESSRNKNPAIQDEINKYALKRIRSISKWKDLTLEQLNSLRKTYSKLRPFFLKGQWLTGKIPHYCYEDYYTCFCLIYDYVEKYTPPELLDIAYFTLDDTYTLYSYASLICNDKMDKFKYMNENTIPDQSKIYYKYLCTHFMWAFNKIYFFIKLSRLYCDHTVCDWPDCNRTVCKEAPNTLFMREFTQYIKICRNKLHETSHESLSNLSMKRVPSLDGFILYNILWNNYIMVPQSIFMKEFLTAANSIDPKFGKLQMAFELIGIDFEISDNRSIYKDIIEMIQDKNLLYPISVTVNFW